MLRSLYLILQLSFSAGVFPSILKESLKAIEGIVRNQLWIEPVVAKVFESIVLVSLYFQLGSRIFSVFVGTSNHNQSFCVPGVYCVCVHELKFELVLSNLTLVRPSTRSAIVFLRPSWWDIVFDCLSCNG